MGYRDRQSDTVWLSGAGTWWRIAVIPLASEVMVEKTDLVLKTHDEWIYRCYARGIDSGCVEIVADLRSLSYESSIIPSMRS